MNGRRVEIIKKQPEPEELQFLEDRIYEFNALATKRDNGQLFARLIHDRGGAIIAGLTGWTWARACEIENLWVHRDWRGWGYGSLLLESAEEEARAQGCSVILIISYTFQAPDFYQKHGYRLEWKLADFPPGHANCFLVKHLEPGR